MTCLKCEVEMLLITREVDLGVGVQDFAVGWECPTCGGEYTACPGCGEALPDHFAWCSEFGDRT
jgi:hypothetical protein